MTDAAPAIAAANTRFAERFERGEIAALVAGHYAATLTLSAPGLPFQVHSQDGLLDLLAGYHRDYRHIRFETRHIRQSGDLACDFGDVHLTPRHDAPPEVLRYLMVWQKGPEGWRVEADFSATGTLANPG
jgi:ketosteroid isomerase-like protein